jgi:hypothetical protein
MLGNIRNYIQKSQMVSQEQLMREFDIKASALEPILELLVQRKEIRQIEGDLCGKRCQDCQGPIYYEWIEKN